MPTLRRSTGWGSPMPRPASSQKRRPRWASLQRCKARTSNRQKICWPRWTPPRRHRGGRSSRAALSKSLGMARAEHKQRMNQGAALPAVPSPTPKRKAKPPDHLLPCTGCTEELKEYRGGHVKACTEPHDVFFREFAFPIQYIRDNAFGHEHVNQVFLA